LWIDEELEGGGRLADVDEDARELEEGRKADVGEDA
jgi:hypothetical protein